MLAAASMAVAQDAAPEAPAAAAPTAEAADQWLPSLQTDGPQQGFDLAVSLARRAVKTAQPDIAVLKENRPIYSTDADSLIAVSRTVADWFAVVAAANNYWQE